MSNLITDRLLNYAVRFQKFCFPHPSVIYFFFVQVHNSYFSRSGVEINFSDVNIVTEVEHFLPREQICANICSLGSFHFFDSCDKNLMGVFIFF
jgi:hypothetical protein